MQIALALLCSFGVAAALLWLLGFLSRRLRLVQQLAFPLAIAALAAGIKVFTLFGIGSVTALDQALSWILVFLISISALRVLGLYVFDVYLRSSRGLRLPPLLPRVVMGAAYVVTALVILPQAIEGVNLTPILASGAITSLVLGLALQPILGNFFSGVVISLERPFRIHDWIQVGDTEGRVVDITWRTTHLRTRNNDTLVIPNGKIANEQIVNYFYPHPLHMERLYVGAHYRTPPYRVKQALLDVTERVDSVLEKPSPSVFLHEFDASAITYELRVWIEDFAHKPRILSHLRSQIWQEFRRHGIVIPFPIRTLEIEPRANVVEVAEPAAEAESRGDEARLYVARGPDRGAVLELGPEPVTVGRASDCDLTLTLPQASKEHFRIELRDGEHHLIDLGSQFGTRVNGARVESHRLHDMDRILIGDSVLVFENDAD